MKYYGERGVDPYRVILDESYRLLGPYMTKQLLIRKDPLDPAKALQRKIHKPVCAIISAVEATQAYCPILGIAQGVSATIYTRCSNSYPEFFEAYKQQTMSIGKDNYGNTLPNVYTDMLVYGSVPSVITGYPVDMEMGTYWWLYGKLTFT